MWPDGNADVLRWVLSSRAPSGRGRRKTSLKGNCTAAAIAEHVSPRRTARRPRGPVSDIAPAKTAHVTGWRNTSPARLGGVRPRRDPLPTRRQSVRSSRRQNLRLTKSLRSSWVARASVWSARGSGPRTLGKQDGARCPDQPRCAGCGGGRGTGARAPARPALAEQAVPDGLAVSVVKMNLRVRCRRELCGRVRRQSTRSPHGRGPSGLQGASRSRSLSATLALVPDPDLWRDDLRRRERRRATQSGAVGVRYWEAGPRSPRRRDPDRRGGASDRGRRIISRVVATRSRAPAPAWRGPG